MAQTLTALLVHVVFSTKDRRPLITPDLEPRLHGYIGGVCRGNGSVLVASGGTEDHVHLLISLSKTMCIADLLLEIKRDSSAWTKSVGREHAGFHWQDGYGAFTVGMSQVPALRRYFARQKEHHRTQGFREELLTLLKRYQVEFDEQFLWD